MSKTPKTATIAQIEANIKRSMAKKKPSYFDIDNTELIKANGISIVHINPNKTALSHHGMTIAFRRPTKKGKCHAIEVATAVCHKADPFTKKMGTKIAANNLLEGKTATIPVLEGDILYTLLARFG